MSHLLDFSGVPGVCPWSEVSQWILKMPPRKLKPSLKVSLYLNKFTIWTCIGNLITSGLVFLIANWVYWKSYRNEYVGLFVIHLLLLLSWAFGSLPVSFHMSHMRLEWIYTLQLADCQGSPCLNQVGYLQQDWKPKALSS